MWRCEGGQKKPADIINSSRGILGKCERCAKYFMLYTNGKVVMHKRKTGG